MSINTAVLAGRLTKDINLSQTQKGNKVARFTVAVQRDKDTSDFINCIAWNKLAEIMNQYCHKGDLVTVEGRIQTRSYDNQQGQRVYVTEVVVNNVQLPPRNNATAQNQQSNTNTYQDSNQTYSNSYGGYVQPSLTQQAEQDAYNDGISNNDLLF